MTDKKKLQLGMNPSTAAGRLAKDILWMLIEETNRVNCHKCGQLMTRDTFSIEHIQPWLDSEDPIKFYFDLKNISFSHLSCNCRNTSRLKYNTDQEKSDAKRISNRKSWSADKRREYYLRSGK